MLTTSGLAETASLVGDPARAAMLVALMDGRALTAGELAGAAGVTAQTASAHLAKLVRAGLLTARSQGRHRYHRLASGEVAQMLEAIMRTGAGPSAGGSARPRTGPRDKALRLARMCYDHLAGRLAVGIADRMVARGHLEFHDEGGSLSDAGADFLRGIGVEPELTRPQPRGRVLCRPCLDWSERRLHIAGRLGAGIGTAFLSRGWIRRSEGSRAVEVTPVGRYELDLAFALDHAVWNVADQLQSTLAKEDRSRLQGADAP